MSGKPFFDTNVLVYAFAINEPHTTTARRLLFDGGKISVQVLNEFASVFRRKFRMTWPETEAALGELRSLLDQPLPITLKLHEAAVELARVHQFSFYDALIVAAAR